MNVQEGEKLAKKLMDYIIYDNGMTSKHNPPVYKQYWVTKISDVVMKFFTVYPEMNSEEVLEIIANGSSDEDKILCQMKHGKELSDVLNNFFDNYPD